MVGFSSPFFILKPVDMARGNRKIFYGVNNRGNKLDYAWRTILPRTGGEQQQPADGRRFRRRPPVAARLHLRRRRLAGERRAAATTGSCRTLPVATEADGRPIVGADPRRVRRRRGLHTPARRHVRHVPRVPTRPPTSTRAHATLTVRSAVGGARTPVPPDRWAFGRCREGPGEPRADHDGHLSVRRLQGRSHLRADLPGEESDGPGARLRRHPRRRVVPPLPDARRRRAIPTRWRRARPSVGIRRAYGSRHLVDRDVHARLAVPRVQRRRIASQGVRRGADLDSRHAPAVRQRRVRAIRTTIRGRTSGTTSVSYRTRR